MTNTYRQRLIDQWGKTREAELAVREEHLKLAKETLRERAQEAAWNFGSEWTSWWADRFDRLRYSPYAFNVATAYDRRYGRFVPMFQTELELAILRAASRVIANTNSFAQALVNGLTSYVIGTGFTYEPRTKRNPRTRESLDPSDYFADFLKDLWEDFQERNGWYGDGRPSYEEERFGRRIVDGESMTALFVDPDTGLCSLRVVEPEQVVQPPGYSMYNANFGILSPQDDAQHHEAIWVFYGDNAVSGTWVPLFDTPPDHFSLEENPYQRVLHCRFNTPRSVKRGCPEFVFDTQDSFAIASNLRRNLGKGAAVQASYAILREHEAMNESDVADMATALADYQRVNPLNNNLENMKRAESAIVDAPKGMKFVDPPGGKNAAGHVEILNAIILAAGGRWNALPWILGGKQETGGMTSGQNAQIAETPFGLSVQRAQRAEKGASVRIFWKVVELYCLVKGGIKGRSFEDLKQIVECHCEPRSIEFRDKDKKAGTDLALFKAKLKSGQTIQAEEGLDSDNEAENIAKWEEKYGPIVPEPQPGQPGANGKPGGANGQVKKPEEQAEELRVGEENNGQNGEASASGGRESTYKSENSTTDKEQKGGHYASGARARTSNKQPSEKSIIEEPLYIQESWEDDSLVLEADQVQEDWNPSQPRGQPGNAGQFGSGGNGRGVAEKAGKVGDATRRPNPANPRLQDAKDFLSHFKAWSGSKLNSPRGTSALNVWQTMKADGMSKDKFIRLLKVLRAHGVIDLEVKDGIVTHIRLGRNHGADLASLVGKPIGQAKEGWEEEKHPRGQPENAGQFTAEHHEAQAEKHYAKHQAAEQKAHQAAGEVLVHEPSALWKGAHGQISESLQTGRHGEAEQFGRAYKAHAALNNLDLEDSFLGKVSEFLKARGEMEHHKAQAEKHERRAAKLRRESPEGQAEIKARQEKRAAHEAKQTAHMEHLKGKVGTLRKQLEEHEASEPQEYEEPDPPEEPELEDEPEEPGEPTEPDDPPSHDDYDDPDEFNEAHKAWKEETEQYEKDLKDYQKEYVDWQNETVAVQQRNEKKEADYKEAVKAHEKEVAKGEKEHQRKTDKWWRQKERLEEKLDRVEDAYTKLGGDLKQFEAQESAPDRSDISPFVTIHHDSEYGSGWDEVVRLDQAQEADGWITIGGHAEGDKKHVGGTPVHTDASGEIDKGPAALKGKKIGELGKGGTKGLREPTDKGGIPAGHDFLGESKKGYPIFRDASGKIVVRGKGGKMNEWAGEPFDQAKHVKELAVSLAEQRKDEAERAAKAKIEQEEKARQDREKEAAAREKFEREAAERQKEYEKNRAAQVEAEKQRKEAADLRRQNANHFDFYDNAHDPHKVESGVPEGKLRITVNSVKALPGYVAKLKARGGRFGYEREFVTERGSGKKTVDVGDGVYEIQNAENVKGRGGRHFVEVSGGKGRIVDEEELQNLVEDTEEEKQRKVILRLPAIGPAVDHEIEGPRPRVGEIIQIKGIPHRIESVGKSRFWDRELLDDMDDFGVEEHWTAQVKAVPVNLSGIAKESWEGVVRADRIQEALDPRHVDGKAGHWVTIHGTHVFVRDNGTIETGPLKGRHIDATGDREGARHFHGKRAAHHRRLEAAARENKATAEKSGGKASYIRGHETSAAYHAGEAAKHEALAKPASVLGTPKKHENPFAKMSAKLSPHTRQVAPERQTRQKAFSGAPAPAAELPEKWKTRKVIDVGKKAQPPGKPRVADLMTDTKEGPVHTKYDVTQIPGGFNFERQGGGSTYHVKVEGGKVVGCSCPDSQHRSEVNCKHCREARRILGESAKESADDLFARMQEMAVQEDFDPEDPAFVRLSEAYTRAKEGGE
jgi:hypothetical protein